MVFFVLTVDGLAARRCKRLLDNRFASIEGGQLQFHTLFCVGRNL